MLPVNEVFWSVQGEGSLCGTPSVFVRLQGCGVRCPWCDTGYALDMHAKDRLADNSRDVFEKRASSPLWSLWDEDALVPAVAAAAGAGRHAVITGGEPCRHDLTALTRGLLREGCGVQVETSGTEPVRVAPGTFVTLSPKACPVLEENWAKASEIKLPVASPADVERWEGRLGEAACPVLVQPVSQDPAATKLCLELCRSRGWRLSVQVHKYIGIL